MGLTVRDCLVSVYLMCVLGEVRQKKMKDYFFKSNFNHYSFQSCYKQKPCTARGNGPTFNFAKLTNVHTKHCSATISLAYMRTMHNAVIFVFPEEIVL